MNGGLEEATFGGQELGKAPEFDQGSILVKFRQTPSAVALQNVLERVSGKIQDANGDRKDDRFSNIANGQIAQIDLNGSVRAAEAIALLANHPAIEYAEPNYIVHVDLTPNDSSYGSLWGMNNTGQTGGTAGADISAEAAWDTTTGSSDVIVGVIDTGIDYNHPDLAANMWVNPGEIAGNGIDDDGNGYVDDVHGINAITGTGNPLDDHDHGTHVSGTIGGAGDNGVGVAGVNWTVSLIGMKFLSGSGSGTTADAIKCIDYAVGLKNSGVNIRVLSNSWGGGGFEQSLEDAIAAANAVDILFVAAAGNDSTNNDNSPHYPSSYGVANVLAVASTDHNDNMSSFSNYGVSSVDLGAPGSSILSTTIGNTYSTFSGTSMATPHVAGAAALLLSYNDTLTTAELITILMDSGDPISALSGKTVSGKRLNVNSALGQVSPPGPSFKMTTSPSSQTINQGDSTSFAIDITSVLGFSDPVTLSLSSSPALNAAWTFNPANPAAVDTTSTLDITTSTGTATGTYSLTITGVGGALTKTKTVSLTVRPEGTVDRTYTNTNPVSIPDNNPTGITSTISVADPMVLSGVAVDVNITHTYVGDLIVKLTSPIGTESVLHNRTGGGADNLYQTFTPAEFANENAAGTWTLSVSDNAGADLGTLDNWSLTFTGVPGGQPGNLRPTAGFTASATDLDASFTDTSTDSDGTIAAWDWSFGDGTTSTAQNPTHTYASGGTYTVTLTVTDDAGATDTTSQDITVLPPGTVSKSYSNTNPVSIPDSTPTGITSTITVPDSLDISSLSVTVNITHTYIGDLIVTLTSPTGTVVTLHNRAGGSADNLNQTYTPTEFIGENTAGVWTLSVSDNASLDTGTLDSWTLDITGASGTGDPGTSIDLAVTSTATQGKNYKINLGWTGASTANVEIYRDGGLIATTSNSGAYQDTVAKSAGNTFVYVVCDEGGATCSNQATASF